MRNVKIGIIGCGVISNTYMKEIKRLYKELDIIACADVDVKCANSQAQKYDIPIGCTVDELLAIKEIEIVVNLTPPRFHSEINKKILLAGKHVFCEKPFAMTLEEAQATVTLAKEHNLLVASAPDTFMGSSLQTCRKVIDDNWIGKPLYVTANMMSAGVETWHPSPEAFYQEGGGPLCDMGPYYFSALIALFGSIKEIVAFSGKGFDNREIYVGDRKGQNIMVEVPTHYVGIIRMNSGMIVNLNISFDIWHSTLPLFEVYGTEGTLKVPDPNMSGGRLLIYRKEQFLDILYDDSELTKQHREYSVEIPELYPYVGKYTRGYGVLDLAYAVVDKTKQRCGADTTCHIVEAISGMMESAQSGKVYQMKTNCDRPIAIELGVSAGKL
jgi:Predicted dehydrogenases and related proteins